MSVQAFWSEDRWTRAYGYRPEPGKDNPYTLGYHIGQDIAGLDWTGMVPALRSGVVARSGRSGKIGGFVVVKVDGEYDTYCHLRTGDLPAFGDVITEGEGIAPLARSRDPRAGHDYMGSASSGPHCHFVVSTRADTAWNPTPGAPIDPRPIIRAVLGGQAAGGDSKPFTPHLEGDDMRAIKLAGAPDSGIIIRGLEAPASIPQQIFEAQVGAYKLDVQELAGWQYDTCVREQWAVFAAYKASLGIGGGSVDVAAVVAGVREALKSTTFTVNAS